MAESRDDLCCMFSDWLDYTCSLVSMRVGGYKALEDESPENRTLNIRFHSNDRAWVEDHLSPVVRERLSFFQEVTYGDKSLRHDAFVFDRFKDDMAISFKTVFVLSKSSVADADFMAMIRTSFQHLNSVKLQKLVLLFLASPSDLDLPFGVQFYVNKDMPHLIWPDSERKRAYFWKKFVEWLKINKSLSTPFSERCYLQSPWFQ